MRAPSTKAYVTLTLVFFGSGLLAILLLWGVRAAVPERVLEANNDVAGNYLQTLGTFYAVLLAFVVFVVWNQFNEAVGAVEHEANEIADLYRSVHGFPAPARDLARDRLRAYVEAVADGEWASMAKGQSSERVARILDELWQALAAIVPGTDQQSTYQEVLGRFNDLSDGRSHRLLASKKRLSPTMWILLIVGALLNVGSMYLFWVPSFL